MMLSDRPTDTAVRPTDATRRRRANANAIDVDERDVFYSIRTSACALKENIERWTKTALVATMQSDRREFADGGTRAR